MGRETAVFGMLVRTRLRHSPVHAAEFAASVFNKSVEVTEIEGGLCFEYTGGLGVIVNTIRRIGEPRRHDPKDRDNALKNRRDKILREAPRLIRNATGKDREWLEVSMLTLDSVFNALALGDADRLARQHVSHPKIHFRKSNKIRSLENHFPINDLYWRLVPDDPQQP
jgi:hypothetical protein